MRRLLVGWAACLVALVPAAPGQTPAERAETAAFVAALQNPDGGFAPAAGRVSNLAATNGAIRALKYSGGSIRDVSACIRFVRSCRDAGGGFAAAPGGAPDVPSTAVGLMAAAELEVASDELAEGAIRFLSEHARSFEQIRIAVAGLEAVQKPSPRFPDWIERVKSDRNPDGTWGQGPGRARATGSAAVALLRMGVDLDRQEAVLAALRDGQRPDGGWSRGDEGSDLESTYRVMRAFVMLKARPDLDRLRGFLARCRRSNGGYATTPGGAADVAGTYFAMIVSRWIQQLTGA